MRLSRILPALGLAQDGLSLNHPGIISSLEDLNRIKADVSSGAQPWIGSWTVLEADLKGATTYSASPAATVTSSNGNMRPDAASAYLAALKWFISDDVDYLNKSIEIINAYVNTVTVVEFDAQITGYFAAFKFSAAVEILRLSTGWTSTYQENWNAWAYGVLYEPICNAGLTGSVSGTPGDGGQGAGCIRCIMALGIATDNATMYNYGVDAYFNNGCSGVNSYIDENGCCGESGRDMAHPQLGIECLTDAAKMGQLQGDTSLWAAGDNRLALAWEWMGKRNLNQEDVPFTNTGTCQTSYSSIIRRPAYELPVAWYTSKGIDMPYSSAVIQYHGPEFFSGSTYENSVYASLVYATSANSTAPIIASGTYNLKPYNTELFVGASSAGSDLTVADTATMSWLFTHAGNDVYRVHPTADVTYAWDAGSTVAGAGAVPYSNGGGGAFGAGVQDHQMWKAVSGPVSGTISFVPLVLIKSDIPRVYRYITVVGGSGTQLEMQVGTSDTTTTNTAQGFVLEAI